MGAISCPEIRETDLTPKERASARDSYVRAFEAQFSDWSAIARACIEVERDRDYLLLGFPTWNAWLLDAAPRSRAYIYVAVGRYKELSKDIPDADLARMSLESAKVLTGVSSNIRQNPKVKSVAIKKAKELREYMRDNYPDQHIEGIVEHKFRFTTSQWVCFEGAYEAYLLTDEGASMETFIEWMLSEVEIEK